jgi:hypothetical protein
MAMDYAETLSQEFGSFVATRQRRPDLVQILLPFHHEDGDLVDVFVEQTDEGRPVRLTDAGMTLMRLSYYCDTEAPGRANVIERIARQAGVDSSEGVLTLDLATDDLYPSLMQFVQAVTRVSSVKVFRREVVRSLFYEQLRDFVHGELRDLSPSQNVVPLPGRPELEVDYELVLPGQRPVYLFGVRDQAKARLAAVCCSEFLRSDLRFVSCIVHEEFDSLTKRDRDLVTNLADKQFTDLAEFRLHGRRWIGRCA